MSVRKIGKKNIGKGERWIVVLSGKNSEGERTQPKILVDPDTGLPMNKGRAQQVERDAITKRHRGIDLNPSTSTVAQFLTYWLEQTQSTRGESTHYNWCSIVRKRIVPTLGPLLLVKLSTAHIERLYQQQAEAGYAISSINNVRTILAGAMKAAVRWQMLERNPATGAVMPRGTTKERPVWTAEQTRVFLSATQDAKFGALWRLLIDSGMRIGEAQALTWHDLNGCCVTVNKTVAVKREGQREVHGGAKSASGNRVIQLMPQTAEALRQHKAAQNARRLGLGPYWHDRDLIFPNAEGKLTHRTTLQDHLDRDCAAAGVPRLTSHELRHTSFTLAAAGGASLHALAKRAGHSKMAITSDLYSHASMDADKVAMEVIRKVLRS